MHFVKRIRLPDGTIHRTGDLFPKFETSDETPSERIGTIYVAGKTGAQSDIDEDVTETEEQDGSIELWQTLPNWDKLSDDEKKKMVQTSWTLCHRIFPNGTRTEEMWPLWEAMQLMADRSGIETESPKMNGEGARAGA
jgi:hypothetical protein